MKTKPESRFIIIVIQALFIDLILLDYGATQP